MQSPLSEFCEKKDVPENIKEAFAAYLRSTYSLRYLLRSDTDTVRIMVNRLTQEQMERAWQEFVSDLRKFLTK
jgi:hypothetical protein